MKAARRQAGSTVSHGPAGKGDGRSTPRTRGDGKPLKEDGAASSSAEGPEKRGRCAGETWKTAVSSRGWRRFGCR